MVWRLLDKAIDRERRRLRTIPILNTRAKEIRRTLRQVEGFLQELTDERDVIVHALREEYEWTFAQIGRYFGMTRQRMHQICREQSALDDEVC